MRISYNWLKDYIDISETPEEIGAVLTQTGLEVEAIEPMERIPGGLNGLVIGEVVECTSHPNADKLKLTKVDAGGGELLSIVCGAPDVAQGQKVIVAPVGTTIYPVGNEPFQIKKTRIRGEISEGMLCAEDEIGLGQRHEGLLILDTDKPNGTPAKTLYETGEDFIYEIGLTPNRGDAASHLGAARDLSAYFKRKIKTRQVAAREIKVNNPIEVIVENAQACPRYSGVTIRGIKVAPSPDWLQWKLKSVGLSPINNVVDISNYVMISIGQPMHAFDADEIAGNRVVVKTLPGGTKFTTLDDVERVLDASDLIICNEKEGICIAGVFGGAKSGVKASTTSIFLESAYFSPDYVRATAMRHGLSTDASFRYERGADPEMTIPALQWAVSLITDIAGGEVASTYIDLYPEEIKPVEIATTFQNFRRLIGIVLENQRIINILNGLGIETKDENSIGFTAVVPSFRSEVTREADLVEEVLRIYGLNNIPLEETFSAGYVASFKEKEPYKVRESLSEYLAGKGFSEIQTNSLTNAKYHHDLQLGDEPVEILNKSSEDLGHLKSSPLYTALESVRHNINRRIKNLSFFEFSKTYSKKAQRYKETEHVNFYMTGDTNEENWEQPAQPVNVFTLSGVVYSVLAQLKIKNFTARPTENRLFAYGLDVLFNTKIVGTMGKLKQSITGYYQIDQDVFYGDFLWKDLVRASATGYEFEELSRFPEVRRDLSLVLDKKVSFNEIKDLSFKFEKKLLNRINVFSVYEGEKLGEGKKSYAISFFLQDKDKTLTDKVIDKTMSGLIALFEKEVGAIIRK